MSAAGRSAVATLEKYGIKASKSKRAQIAVEARASEIVKETVAKDVAKGPSRNDLMLKAKAAGIRNFRILNKEELFQVLDHPGDAVSVVEKAVTRWKSGWGTRKPKEAASA